MVDANELLFERLFDGVPLFKNQLDLVTSLVSTPAYMVPSDDLDARTKAINRLKAYISQLLSGNANRLITQDLRVSLSLLLAERIKDKRQREELILLIFESMRRKSSIPSVKEVRQPSKNFFQNDIAESSYISIITATTINADLIKDDRKMSLTDFFLLDLYESLFNKKSLYKQYRFNFPIRSDCEVFWLGLESGLAKLLEQLFDNQNLISFLHDYKFVIKSTTYNVYQKYQELAAEILTDDNRLFEIRQHLIRNISKDMVEFLNRNETIKTFHVEEPIYSIPLVALDPNIPGLTKLYALIEEENRQINILKCSHENMLLWRRFVWNQLITSKKARNIPCPYLEIAPDNYS
ncbi:hypothetical protein CLV51_105352 [Chitinophaga niastensis]|uniref:Uncharacterized protein n=1 Tax=Chitinophaga niastensis TaxID=536980 RepID=A0A2P8HFI7_CHINA|nr:hypothetical protein [Chitinophaga niastensis]PSL44977.1 hypothetical protein CLV51_105352 [Chitinophaga niastensis]